MVLSEYLYFSGKENLKNENKRYRNEYEGALIPLFIYLKDSLRDHLK